MRLSVGTPPTVIFCGPRACSMAVNVAFGSGPIVPCRRRTACSLAMPSGVGSIEQVMPPARAASMARRQTTRSSRWRGGRRLVAPTIAPEPSTVSASAGPQRRMSCPSGSTNTRSIRCRPPRNCTSAGSGVPFAADSFTAEATALSDTVRDSLALPDQPASARARVRSAASDSRAFGSSVRTIPSASTEMPPTAWLPKPP